MNHADLGPQYITLVPPVKNPFYVGPGPANFGNTVATEISKGRDAIVAATGATPKWLEPPYGDYDTSVQTAVTAAGETLCAWTVDSTDSSEPVPTKDQIVAAATAVEAGGLIEMHDASQQTADAVVPIITQLRNEKGLLPGQITASATGVPGPFGPPLPPFYCTAGPWPAS